MADVLIALVPCIVMGAIYFGMRFLIIIAISVATSVLFELALSLLVLKRQTIDDLSAAVTGVFIAMLLPVTVPLWYPAFGALFAIGVTKWLFGGVGKNIFNPALSAVAVLYMTNPQKTALFTAPFTKLPLFREIASNAFPSAPTVLSQLHDRAVPSGDILRVLAGNTQGFPGTVCILVIIASAVYLLYRRIISIHIPAAILATVLLLAVCFPRVNDIAASAAYELMGGALIFCAVFCANDPVSTPNSASGKIFFGVGVGAITMIIRQFGSVYDGIVFAILIMNALSFAMDKLIWRIRPKGVSD